MQGKDSIGIEMVKVRAEKNNFSNWSDNNSNDINLKLHRSVASEVLM